MEIFEKYNSLSSENLLTLISKGDLNKEEAEMVALIMEERFPTPF